jgi:hypothetical protein
MTQEALKLALEALEANDQLINGTGTNGGLVYCMDGYYSDCFDVDPINKQTEEAITAIKEALAKEKALQALHSENERLGLYKEAYAERTWVDLTRTQMQDVYFAVLEEHRGGHQVQGQLAFGEALQVKIKERNT